MQDPHMPDYPGAAHNKPRRKGLILAGIIIGLPLLLVIMAASLYRANTGVARYPERSGAVLVIPFSCGVQTLTGSPEGPADIVFHGQVQAMHAIVVYGFIRPQLTTNVSTADMETAATQANAAVITENAIHSVCRGYIVGLISRIIAGLLCYLIGTAAHALSHDRRRLNLVMRQALGMITVIVIVLGGTCYANYEGARHLLHVPSLSALFSYAQFGTAPPEIGPEHPGDVVIVGGDSRESGYNGSPLQANPTPDDVACERAQNDVAMDIQAQIGQLVMDTTCPGADVVPGYLTSEYRNGRHLPPQLSLWESAVNAQYLEFDAGLNSSGWGLLIAAAQRQSVNIGPVPIAITTAIDQLRPEMNDLAYEIRHHMPSHLHVIIMGSYAPFQMGATCSDTRGMTPREMELLINANDAINTYLRQFAIGRGYSFFVPKLIPLCVNDPTGWGPDIIGTSSKYRFHPTKIGDLEEAQQALAYIALHRAPLLRTSSAAISPSLPHKGKY